MNTPEQDTAAPADEKVTLALCCGHHLACHDWHEDGWGHQGCGHKGCACPRTFSEAFAARMTQEQSEALREAAADLRDNAASAWGGERSWFTTGRHVADLCAEWVEEFADDRLLPSEEADAR